MKKSRFTALMFGITSVVLLVAFVLASMLVSSVAREDRMVGAPSSPKMAEKIISVEESSCGYEGGRIYHIDDKAKWHLCGNQQDGWSCWGGQCTQAKPYQFEDRTKQVVTQYHGFSPDQLIKTWTGECKPYVTVCSSSVGTTYDGKPFNGTVFCAPRQVNGNWFTQWVPSICPSGTRCREGGAAPMYAYCE